MPTLQGGVLLAAMLQSVCNALPSSSNAPQFKLLTGDILKGSLCPPTSAKSFRATPFAQSPNGSLRFLPPQKLNISLNSYGDPFDATHVITPCPQFGNEFLDTYPTPSEDW